MAQQKNSTTADCRNLEEDLVLFHYGDLAGAERDELAAHVTACAGCAAYLEELAALLPLTVKSDQPPQEFWLDYRRELRHKLDGAVTRRSWWPNFSANYKPGYLGACAAAAVVVLALTFTLGKSYWTNRSSVQDDELAALLPVAEHLEFFRAMDLLDELELLEFMGSKRDNAA